MIEAREHLTEMEFESGDYLFKQGDSTGFLFLINKGEVEVYLDTPEGGRVTLAILGEGQVVGEFAIVDYKPRSASARALTPVDGIKVSAEGYQGLLEGLPEWAMAVIETLVDRLRKADEMIAQSELEDPEVQARKESILAATK